jgi:hypothetical protein
MKKIISFSILFLTTILSVSAADNVPEGITYFLPKTQLKFTFTIEKTSFTPGEYAGYAERYLKRNVNSQPSTAYRILNITMSPTSIPDSSKQHTVVIDKKHSIVNLNLENGILRAINTEVSDDKTDTPKLTTWPKAKPLNVHDYMSEDMLNAGNETKLAQLMAQEIYDIRDSRNQLSRGEADNMPKDGEQLKLMLANLDVQERAFTEAFTGYEVRDTLTADVMFTPEKDKSRTTLCRFSTNFGIIDDDDLSGAPIYIQTEDLNIIPKLDDQTVDEKKKKTEDIGLYVNLPGKIRLKLLRAGKTLNTFETFAAQFGHEESLSGELFGKKFISKLILDPISGNVIELKTQPLD